MKTSKEILQRAGLYPKLRLGEKCGNAVASTGPHRVKIIEDKIIKKLSPEGQEEHYVRYVFEEDGERKQYDCRMKAKGGSDPHYLVQALADVEEDEEIILEMKKAGVKSYIEVTRPSVGETESVALDDDEPGSAGRDEETNDHDEAAQ